MSVRRHVAIAGLMVLGLFSESAVAQPNIILILTDDFGYGDMGVLFQNQRRLANDRAKPWELTPRLDRLATEGVQLRDHYCAAPVCAPSRASLLLGVSQGHANVRDNQFDKALEDNHTLATVLREAGYRTVAIGKWGLQGTGPGGKDPNRCEAPPARRGFDDYFGYLTHQDGHEHYPKEAPYAKGHKACPVWLGNRDITPGLDKCYTADLWTAWAKKWISDQVSQRPGKPFFMYLAYDTPHAVTELPTQSYPAGGGLKGGLQWLGSPGKMINTASGTIDSWVYPEFKDATWDHDHNAATPEVPWPDVNKRYATAIRRLDDAVGDIIKLLQDLNIDDNTLVVFTSDNGPSMESYLREALSPAFFGSYGPFDGIKRDCLEGGVRIPTLVRWPGHIAAGRIITRPSISYDWLPTFAEAAGLPAPARSDGVSLLPELTGIGVQRDRGYVYMEYQVGGTTPDYPDFTPRNRGRIRNQMQAVRIGDYVGLRYDIKAARDPFEIYRVADDPREANNLAAGMPDLGRRMREMVLQVRRPDESARRPYDDEPVPALPLAAVDPGIQWQWYAGTFPWVPAVESLVASGRGQADRIAWPDKLGTESGAILLTGNIRIGQAGNYTFSLKADTGALLRIHDATVIDADHGYAGGSEVRGSIKLAAGIHPFRLYAVHRGAARASLSLNWSIQ